MKRKISLNIIRLVLAITILLPNTLVQAERMSMASKPQINLVYSGLDLAIFELLTPEYSLELLNTENGSFQTLRVGGYGSTDQSGYPQLPSTSILLGIPSEGDVRIDLISDDVTLIKGIDSLTPYPESFPWDGNSDQVYLSYTPDPKFYSQSQIYPITPVRVEEYGWLRNQRFVRIGLYPFQYNPADRTVIWHQRLGVEVHFNGNSIQKVTGNGNLNIYDDNGAFETLLKNYILNYQEARAWRTFPVVEASHQTSVTGERIRIGVDHDGLYRISYTDLVNAGMGSIDPRTFQMTNQGLDVAITVVGEEDGILNEGDYIIFYGEAFHGDAMASWYADESLNWNTYTQQLSDGSTTPWHPEFNADMMEKYTYENVYWLQSTIEPNQTRMQIADGTPGEAAIPAYYHTTAHAEIQNNRWEFHFTSEDTWFWQYVRDTSTQSFTTNLSAIYSEPFNATVRSEYVAYTYSDFVSPDHHTLFHINSRVEPINESYWDGRSRHSFESDIPSADLLEGTNTLYFNIVEDDTVTSWIFFDWFEIDYLRRFVAENDVITFPGENPGAWRYQLEGFSQADILVFDITDPHLPTRVVNAQTYMNGSYWAEFQYTHDLGARFYALGTDAIQTPKSITRYVPPDLRTTNDGADYIIISNSNFIDSAQSLADYRSSQGLRVRIVDIQVLYNEFNEGITHPIAIKNFLEYAFAHWAPPAPLYVVLVGDGHWDLLDSRYTTTPVYMQPNLSWVDPNQGEVDSANLLTTIVGDDPLPDLHIGRIPVNTPQEFQNVIDKIITFEQTLSQPWQLNNTFIADNIPDSGGNFPDMADYIISQYIEPYFNPIRIYENDFGCTKLTPENCSEVTAKIFDTLNITGTLFTTYIGHASIQYWSGESIFVPSDISALNNANKLPVILSMDCLDGYWIHPLTQPSMAEVFLRTPNVGAAATFSPTGLAVGLGHLALMDGFYKTVYQDGAWEMGAATLGAKIALYEAGFFRDMLQTYTIFGDPALKFPSPYAIAVSPLMAQGGGLPGSQVSYILQILNLGTLPDTIELVVEGNTWLTTLSNNVLNLMAGGAAYIVITVDIPDDAILGISDTAMVRVRSGGDTDEQESVSITTSAVVKIRLPLIRK